MPTLKTAVFSKDGREFILPGLQYVMGSDLPADEDGDPIQITWKAINCSVMLQAKLEWREYQTSAEEPFTAEIPSVTGKIIGRQFEHGAVNVWLISGPEFDAIADTGDSDAR
jgi:hypothetical protein